MSDEYDDETGRRTPGPADPSGSVDPTPGDLPGAAADGTDAAEQGRVARILAAAGGDEPMPADVAARLDALVADLASATADPVSTGSARPGSAPTTPRTTPPPTTSPPGADPPDELAARRRSRRWPRLLVAAASVSVLGLGATTLLDDLGTGGADSESTAGMATEDGDAASAGGALEESVPGAAARQQSAPDDGAAGSGTAADPRALDTPGVLRLRSDALAVGLQRAADLSRPVPVGRELSGQCVQPDLGAGDEWLRVRLDGAPAVLVLRAPASGRRTAELFTCDDGDTPVAVRRIDAR